MDSGIPLDQVLRRQLEDPAFREVWERHAVASAVSVWLVAYRAQHGLSQRALAERVGMKQPAIARLESGDVEPKLSTLLRLVQALETPLDLRLEAGTVLAVNIARAAA